MVKHNLEHFLLKQMMELRVCIPKRRDVVTHNTNGYVIGVTLFHHLVYNLENKYSRDNYRV